MALHPAYTTHLLFTVPSYALSTPTLQMFPQHLSPEYASFSCHHSSDPTLHHLYHQHHPGFLGGTSGKEPPCQCRRSKRLRFNPWVGQIPWRRAWQPTPVFSPGESHGQRSLAGYSLWGRKEWATTERLTHTHFIHEQYPSPLPAAQCQSALLHEGLFILCRG